MSGIDPRLIAGPDRPRSRAATRFQLIADPDLPSFTDLPWDVPLEDWTSQRLVRVVRGIGRHVVRFVAYGGDLFALKELPQRIALREYATARHLADASVPAVEAVGVVSERDPGGQLDAVLITRYLEFSLPYRSLFSARMDPESRGRLLDALATLLVRLHIAGFWWGDCSLSNTLFRRDAGALEAYLVDAETAEVHPTLSPGQRLDDVHRAARNTLGELFDIAASRPGAVAHIDSAEVADGLRARYTSLFEELTGEERFGADETYRIERRLRRLNELGFDAREVVLRREGGTITLRLDPRVVEPGHHRRRLHSLTGLDVHENQARGMLQDIDRYRHHLERTEGVQLAKPMAARRWLTEVFTPSVEAIPAELRGKREPAESFHEILAHRWCLSERAGHDVGTRQAVRGYVQDVLPPRSDEQTMLGSDNGLDDGAVDLEVLEGGDGAAEVPPGGGVTGCVDLPG
ncbi:MAG: DUF4032 domain-containing protein [Thermoleophilia bacterium]